MSRALCLLAAAAVAAALPSAASAKGFSSGVASAEVTQKTALLWTRADKTGKVRLTVARDKKLEKGAKTFSLKAGKDRDNTVQRRVGKLKPGTTYYFRFSRKGAKSDRGTFRTAPKAGSTKKVRFAWTGDSDPVLEILTANVIRCGHHAAVGPVDQEALFYLQSRGLDIRQSLQLLVGGFFQSVVDGMPLTDLAEDLTARVSAKLATATL